MRTSSSKNLPFSTIVATLTVAALLLPWDAHCFGHPALPIPNSRPSRERFTVLSGPDAPTSSREAAKLYISKFDKSFPNEKPPSQIESIVANAKSLSASLFSRNLKLTNPTRQKEVMTALTAGLAVSLAMVPEAVSFSFVVSADCFQQFLPFLLSFP